MLAHLFADVTLERATRKYPTDPAYGFASHVTPSASRSPHSTRIAKLASDLHSGRAALVPALPPARLAQSNTLPSQSPSDLESWPHIRRWPRHSLRQFLSPAPQPRRRPLMRPCGRR